MKKNAISDFLHVLSVISAHPLVLFSTAKKVSKKRRPLLRRSAGKGVRL
jgi:hypothetical protein